MLCYHSSRRTADVIHDTMVWLSANRVILRVMAIPAMVMVAALLYIVYSQKPVSLDNNYMLKYISAPLLSENNNPIGSLSPALYYALLTFGTSLMIVPLMLRYFTDRRSLLHASTTLIMKEMNQHLLITLIVSVTAALGVYVICVCNWFLMILTALALVIILPYEMMWSHNPRFRSSQWKGILTCSVYIFLVCLLAITFPVYASALLTVTIAIFEDILPGITDGLSDSHELVTMIMAWASGVGFCGAVVIFEVSALILHGSVMESHKKL